MKRIAGLLAVLAMTACGVGTVAIDDYTCAGISPEVVAISKSENHPMVKIYSGSISEVSRRPDMLECEGIALLNTGREVYVSFYGLQVLGGNGRPCPWLVPDGQLPRLS